jgi:hypothetical protein
MITVATPLDLPIIKPDDWATFWNIWHANKQPLVKVKSNVDATSSLIGTSDIWQGIDIFTAGDTVTAWHAPLVDIKDTLPELYKTCATLPFKNVYRVRLIESLKYVDAHTDDGLHKWSIRAYFHYTDTKPQWYFTKPDDAQGHRHYFALPAETNWFAYNDKNCFHGTDYDAEHPKVLLQVYAIDSPTVLVYNSMAKYKEHTISL